MNKKTEGDHAAFGEVGQTGLTKREYFAAMAMQGMSTIKGLDAEGTVYLAVKYADALIKKLNENA